MKALSKDQEKEKTALVDEIRTAHAELSSAIETYNSDMEEAQKEVQGKLEALNAKIQEAKEWAGNISSEMESYYDERSENWQESDKGQNYSSWKDDYENIDDDDVEIEFPDALEAPECEVADNLENLPDEPS